MITSFNMESLLIEPQMMSHEQQLEANHLHRRRRCLRHRHCRGGNVFDSCSSSNSINGEEEEEDDKEVKSSTPSPASSSPLQDMTSILLQLPLKRGMSKHYNGKSQSFTSLSNVKSLEDLSKQENPSNKKLKLYNSPSSTRKERDIN